MAIRLMGDMWGLGTVVIDPTSHPLSRSEGSKHTLQVSFRRTLKVPNNELFPGMPPDFGSFPLFPVSQFEKALPSEIRDKGGVFFPMYQKEAMWVRLKSRSPFAVKIYLGGVNIISGESKEENFATVLRRGNRRYERKSLQDYVVTPDQAFVDVIASSDGEATQFVLSELESRFSAEMQAVSELIAGSLQFEVTPRLRGFHHGQDSRVPEIRDETNDRATQPDRYAAASWDRGVTLTFNTHILNPLAFQQVTGIAAPPSPIDSRKYKVPGLLFKDTEVQSDSSTLQRAATEDFPKSCIIKLNPKGPHRKFRTISELEEEIDVTRVVSFTTLTPSSQVPGCYPTKASIQAEKSNRGTNSDHPFPLPIRSRNRIFECTGEPAKGGNKFGTGAKMEQTSSRLPSNVESCAAQAVRASSSTPEVVAYETAKGPDIPRFRDGVPATLAPTCTCLQQRPINGPLLTAAQELEAGQDVFPSELTMVNTVLRQVRSELSGVQREVSALKNELLGTIRPELDGEGIMNRHTDVVTLPPTSQSHDKNSLPRWNKWRFRK